MKTIFLGAILAATALSAYGAESRIEQYLREIEHKPEKLYQFMNKMPKGGDIHFHETGSSLPENLLRYAYSDHLCINSDTMTVFKDPNCPANQGLNTAIEDKAFYRLVVDAWSMQDFKPGKETGHDHFFSAFSKYGLIAHTHLAEIEAEITTRAANENESYLEIMVSPDGSLAADLGSQLDWRPDFIDMRNQLLAKDFDHVQKAIKETLDNQERDRQIILKCQSDQPEAGCAVKVKYIYQIKREQAPERVFAQMLAGFEAASKEPRIVGVNMVQAEDGKISMRDYHLHMQMMAFFHELYPNVHISLHAGELAEGFVAPEGLKFHINEAIRLAKAERIGHGVDVLWEDNSNDLLKLMADQHRLVEINLASNADILNIEGNQHPILAYMKAGVPIVLATDDEGITRENLTKQFVRAEVAYHFSYATLKNIARNSLYYSFLPGENLWSSDEYSQVVRVCAGDILGANKVSVDCRQFLAANEKAAMQWNLEGRFNHFEKQY